MFQFPAFASYTLCIQGKIPYDNAWKLEVFQPAPEPAEPPPHQRRRPSGLYCHPSFEVKQTSQTIQISQAFKVGFPIRRSMDQSLFAAPHGLSQRITSFIACACQGIHQMPLFHLIVLIANAHRLVAVLEENEQQTGLPFTTQPMSTMPSTCSTQPHCRHAGALRGHVIKTSFS